MPSIRALPIVITMLTFTVCVVIAGSVLIPLIKGTPMIVEDRVMIGDLLKMAMGGIIAFVGHKISNHGLADTNGS